MVHVTFNEKVECHQYSPMPTQTELGTPDERGRTVLKYSTDFLKGLKTNPLSQICPDVVKTAIAEGKGWTGNDPFPVMVRQPPVPLGRSAQKSVFARPQNPPNPRPMRRHEPYFPNNQTHFGGQSRNELFVPIEPIGSSRYTSQYTNQYRNYPNRNYVPETTNFPCNLLPDFAQQRYQKASEIKDANEDEAEPEWYRGGPTSPNDFIELHGFDGPGHQDSHNRNDQLGCVDGNVSGGAASSNSGSPPAKSTPAKVSFNVSNDTQRNKRSDAGRQSSWQKNLDNRQNAGNPFMNEFFKSFAGAQQHQSNVRGAAPFVSVQDVESSLLYDRLKFRQMVAQMQTQNLCNSLMYPLHAPIPNAAQVLSEIDKILRTSNDPIYKRPEVRALTKSIVEAVIPPINMMKLLKNPLTEPQNRETIQAALNIISQAKLNAAKSMKSHVPTESELRAHMDAIMQDAIIKKRMENLNNELLKTPYQQGARNFQTFQQMFRPNAAGRFENHSQSDSRGQCQSFENGSAQENNLNRWFSPNLLNKGPNGLLQMPTESLRSEDLENKFKQTLKCSEKEAK